MVEIVSYYLWNSAAFLLLPPVLLAFSLTGLYILVSPHMLFLYEANGKRIPPHIKNRELPLGFGQYEGLIIMIYMYFILPTVGAITLRLGVGNMWLAWGSVGLFFIQLLLRPYEIKQTKRIRYIFRQYRIVDLPKEWLAFLVFKYFYATCFFWYLFIVS